VATNTPYVNGTLLNVLTSKGDKPPVQRREVWIWDDFEERYIRRTYPGGYGSTLVGYAEVTSLGPPASVTYTSSSAGNPEGTATYNTP
jgi:hypothetical protein